MIRLDNNITNSDWTKARAFDFPTIKTLEDFMRMIGDIPLSSFADLPWVQVAPPEIRDAILASVEKARFASRSEAGRYAAEIRWMGHISDKVKLAFRVVKPKSGSSSDLTDAQNQETQQILDAGWGGGNPAAAWKETVMKQIVAAMGEENPNHERYQRIMDKLDTMLCFTYNSYGDTLLERCVSALISGWAITSNDSNPLALAKQDIAQEMFGLTEADEWVLVDRKMTPAELQQVADRKNIILNDPEIKTLIQDVLKTQYELTQKYFAEKGITEIEVFRGMEMLSETRQIIKIADETLRDLPDDVPKATKEEVQFVWNAIRGGTYRADVSTRPLSSWSLSHEISEEFATREGVLIRAKVPVKDIFATPQTGFGCFQENEVVVLGTGSRNVDYAFPSYAPNGGSYLRDFDFTDEDQIRELALEIFFERRRRFGVPYDSVR